MTTGFAPSNPETETLSQPGILAPVPNLGRSLGFRLKPAVAAGVLRQGLERLQQDFDPACGVVGLGEPALLALGKSVPGLRGFPALNGVGCAAPSSQQALWVFLRGNDRGQLFDAAERLESLLSGAFVLDDVLDTFKYDVGRDLTGYEDGTENPIAGKAVEAALVGAGVLRGSSFVAVQRWVHDLHAFRAFPPGEQDLIFGRERGSNEEIASAPASAHVKRTAQEDFEPSAFMVRRSIPWATGRDKGLEFISFVENLDRYERVLLRMLGKVDGVVDALFSFSKPVTGSYYWCPPIANDRLDLTALGF